VLLEGIQGSDNNNIIGIKRLLNNQHIIQPSGQPNGWLDMMVANQMRNNQHIIQPANGTNKQTNIVQCGC